MKTWGDSGSVLPAAPRRPHEARIRFLTAGLAILLIILGLESSSPLLKYRIFPWLQSHRAPTESASPKAPIEWDSVSATESLVFKPCYDGYECAKLKLPFDYFNGTFPDSTISLAITKLPARVPIDDPRYGGPILINPGGPGGPGALFALGSGRVLQTVVDSAVDPDSAVQPDDFMNSERYFDIIGFDPRGIGWSDPGATCMPDEPSFWSWKLRESTEGILGSSDAALGRLWSMNHAYGTSCKQALDDEHGPDIKQYMTTASVARDMLEIVEKHADYVAEKAAQLAAEKAKTRARCKRPEVPDHKSNSAKLQYWGFSYGTYLGFTFASMFPDRVGRLILDGVVNADDYNTSLGNGSLHDAEKAMSSFYTFCVRSGPELCPLATSTSSAKDIEHRVQSIVQSLYHNPIEISSAHGPDILTYSDIKSVLFSAIYQPAVAFPFVAHILAAVEAGGGSIIEDLARAYRPTHIYSCPINGSAPAAKYFSDVTTTAILCSDGQDQTSESIEAFEKYLDLLVSISPTSGAIWSMLRMKCASWKIKAVHKFGDDFGGNTSHPILFLSNTADPVTPLRSAKIMSAKFPGSAVLVQDSAGHCSISTPTPCTMLFIRSYFQTGVLPAPNTICTPPNSPFSLNSTDPESPFYDTSLADSVSHRLGPDMEALGWESYMDSDEGQIIMDAGKSLQRSFAENGVYYKVHTNERVDKMLASWVREHIVL
ncbi:alpha/beta-hydrolase [Melanomma pulvis-pyrius CBS 109.77]|uniref:Alpha/beta-hydrolase n=1 Tax=Melanomma pulvis-pyrius CBS 109.77 TaxID=1314802 RepID=A0A6A6WS93_9PLEO|nr:alpha/beta-hydrolase [Melanomma pulvis-pyrius CBS 109.77]